MTITTVGKNKIRDLLSANFTKSGIGLDSTAAGISDSSLFGGGTTIDSFDSSAASWTAAADALAASDLTSSDYFQEGTGAMGLASSYVVGSSDYSRTVTAFDSTSKQIYMWFYLSAQNILTSADDSIIVTLGTGGFTNANYYNFSYDSLSAGWNSLKILPGTYSGQIGAGLTTTSTDSVKVSFKNAGDIDTPNARLDYLRYYEAGTMGVTESLTTNSQETGDIYWKSIHSIPTNESNGLQIYSAGDSDSSSVLLNRFTFAVIDKGSNTELQIDKYFYID